MVDALNQAKIAVESPLWGASTDYGELPGRSAYSSDAVCLYKS
jgi:hypothetical protein